MDFVGGPSRDASAGAVGLTPLRDEPAEVAPDSTRQPLATVQRSRELARGVDIDICAPATFLLLLFVAAFGEVVSLTGLRARAEDLVLALAILALVVLCEFGYSAMARARRIPTRDAPLLPGGAGR